MNVTALIACGCLSAAASLTIFVVASVQARAVERSPDRDRAHELRVLLRRLVRIPALTGGAAGGLCLALTNWPGAGTGGAALTAVVILACVVLPIAAARRPVIAAYARTRGIPLKALRTSPRHLVTALAAVTLLGWPAAVALAIGHAAVTEVAVLLACYVAVNPILLGLLAPVLAWALGARALPADAGQRVSALAGQAGVPVRGRMIPGRARKLANAAQSGWLPGLRYVLITDYLLDELTATEAGAVVAHELGHGFHHHVRIRQFRASVRMAPFGVLVLAVAQQQPVLSVVGIVGLAGVLVTARRRGARAIRQELAADDLAASLVGREALAAALERLTELNAIKRDTTLGWDRSVGHPGMAQRIARLRAGQGSPGDAAPAGAAARPAALSAPGAPAAVSEAAPAAATEPAWPGAENRS